MSDDKAGATDLARRVEGAYEARFGSPPTHVVRAPGRVNLIGEHTDYNEGFVLPVAIDREVRIALGPREDGRVRLFALDLDQTTTVDLEALSRGGNGWTAYLKGMAWSLRLDGHSLHGWEGVLAGDVPVGAGLASSAALELALGRAFAIRAGIHWDSLAMAKAARRAENDWVGVPCGIMDQLTAAVGRPGHALLLDCRSLKYEALPLPSDLAIVVLDTGVRRSLAASLYRQRRAECRSAAEAMGVTALRDLEAHDLEQLGHRLDPVLRRRARHVVGENARVRSFAADLRSGKLDGLGELMLASHASLREDFEVSSTELDLMVNSAKEREGCLGARMTGAGFGGCAVALVVENALADFIHQVARDYGEATGREPSIYACRSAPGASVVR
jgi:galactokinase